MVLPGTNPRPLACAPMEETPPTVSTQGPPRPRRWPLGALTLIVVAFVGVGLWVLRDDEPTTPTIPELGTFPNATGDVAPDFSLELLDGSTFRLSSHLSGDGRPVVLNLWASWCTPCRDEMPALDAAAGAHPEVFFLGVAVEDDPAAAAEFAEEIAVGYALAIDEADRVGRRYPSPGLPTTFFISPDGRIAKTVFGAIDIEEIEQYLTEAFGGES